MNTKCLVVITGGEPFFKGNLDSNLVLALKDKGFYVAVETNGTCLFDKKTSALEQANYIWTPNWITVSPKANTEWKTISKCFPINELKVVHPQKDLDMEDVLQYAADHPEIHKFLQPMDVGDETYNRYNLEDCLEFCYSHPGWRLSLQTHKMIGLP